MAAQEDAKILLDIDQGYAPVFERELRVGEQRLVNLAIGTALDMRDAEGRRRQFILPPAVGLAIVRALFGKAPDREKPSSGGQQAVIFKYGAGESSQGFKDEDGRIWQRSGLRWIEVIGATDLIIAADQAEAEALGASGASPGKA